MRLEVISDNGSWKIPMPDVQQTFLKLTPLFCCYSGAMVHPLGYLTFPQIPGPCNLSPATDLTLSGCGRFELEWHIGWCTACCLFLNPHYAWTWICCVKTCHKTRMPWGPTFLDTNAKKNEHKLESWLVNYRMHFHIVITPENFHNLSLC